MKTIYDNNINLLLKPDDSFIYNEKSNSYIADYIYTNELFHGKYRINLTPKQYEEYNLIRELSIYHYLYGYVIPNRWCSKGYIDDKYTADYYSTVIDKNIMNKTIDYILSNNRYRDNYTRLSKTYDYIVEKILLPENYYVSDPTKFHIIDDKYLDKDNINIVLIKNLALNNYYKKSDTTLLKNFLVIDSEFTYKQLERDILRIKTNLPIHNEYGLSQVSNDIFHPIYTIEKALIEPVTYHESLLPKNESSLELKRFRESKLEFIEDDNISYSQEIDRFVRRCFVCNSIFIVRNPTSEQFICDEFCQEKYNQIITKQTTNRDSLNQLKDNDFRNSIINQIYNEKIQINMGLKNEFTLCNTTRDMLLYLYYYIYNRNITHMARDFNIDRNKVSLLLFSHNIFTSHDMNKNLALSLLDEYKEISYYNFITQNQIAKYMNINQGTFSRNMK